MENDALARRKKFIIDVLFVAVILAIIYVLLKYVLGLIMPFFIALILAAVARPLSRALSSRTRKVRQKGGTYREVKRKLRLNRSVSAIVSVILVFIILAALLFVVGMLCFDKILDLVEYAPTFFSNTLQPSLEDLAVRVELLLSGVNGRLALDESSLSAVRSALSGIITTLGTKLTELSGSVLLKISNVATKVPSFLLSVIICVIATVFLSVDFDSMRLFLNRNLPKRALEVSREFLNTLVDTVWQFLKSYSLIFLITAAEISIGFLLVGQRHAILFAMLVALFDAFPIVGSGMILMPFSIITLITGNIPKGLGLMAVWIVVVVVRQIIEPRIVGHRVGLRPIVTLFCMYVGTELFGGIGLFALPILIAILVDLNRDGVIRLFRPLPFEGSVKNDKKQKPRGARAKADRPASEQTPGVSTGESTPGENNPTADIPTEAAAETGVPSEEAAEGVNEKA